MPALAPLPPELALDAAPLTDFDLERVTQAVMTACEDRAMTPGEIIDSLLFAEVGPAAQHLLPEAARRWRCTDPGAAEWAMRQVAAIDVEATELAAQRDDWSARIGAWFASAARPLAARRAFFAAHLEAYALAERARDENRKTVSVPSGKVRTTGTGPKAIVADEAAVIAWARENLLPATELAQALLAEGDGPAYPVPFEEVVKVTTSILLTGLREVADITRVPIATRWEAELACGHTLIAVIDTRPAPPDGEEDPGDGSPWAIGDLQDCLHPDCTELGHQPVAVVTAEPVTVLVSSVPGTAVEDGAVTAKVAPGA